MVAILDRAVDALHHAIRSQRGGLCRPVFHAVFGAGFVEPMVAAGLLVAPCKPIRKLKALFDDCPGIAAAQRLRRRNAMRLCHGL